MKRVSRISLFILSMFAVWLVAGVRQQITGVWSWPAGQTLNNAVIEIISAGGDTLYAGGFFTDAGGASGADRIAYWDGLQWSWPAGMGLNEAANSLALDGAGILYAGGSFSNAGGDADADSIARWDGTAWSWPTGMGFFDGILQGTVAAIAVDANDDLYVGGSFDTLPDADAVNIAFWDSSAETWSWPTGMGLNGSVFDLAIDSSGLVYAVGQFINAGGDPDADMIAIWDPVAGTWSWPGPGLNNPVRTIALGSSGDLYVGGLFTDAGGIAAADYIAYWDGSAWSSLGPTALSDEVTDVALSTTGDLYVAGSFTDAGGDVDGDNIAVWDGSQWSWPSGMGLNSVPLALALNGSQDALFAGGFFDNAGGDVNADFIARLAAVPEPTATPTPTQDPGPAGQPSAGAIPSTGFKPGSEAAGESPNAKRAPSLRSELLLSIPSLNVSASIVGIARQGASWDVSWLTSQVGYLEGSAFPTWQGNTVLTAHVWNADGLPGPFARIKDLQWGDQFTIHAWELQYTYEVRDNFIASPRQVGVMMQHRDLDWVTLVTCEGFSESSEIYRFRRVVQAVLVSVTSD